MTVVGRRGFELLSDLAADNSRAWFDAHRGEFRRELTEPMVAVLEEVSTRVASSPWPMSGGAHTMMRQHRDTRFADTAYHLAVRGLLSHHGGRLGPTEAGVHIELTVDGGFVGAGLHRPAAATLRPIRQRMVERPDEIERVVASLAACGHGLPDEFVPTMPRGFSAHADEAVAQHLRRRSWTVTAPIPVAAWRSGEAVDIAANLVCDAAPLLAFLSGQPTT